LARHIGSIGPIAGRKGHINKDRWERDQSMPLVPLSAVRGYVEQENVMDKSVYEARWLLGPVFVLWFGCVAVGVVFG
jgi:hypothetical protein